MSRIEAIVPRDIFMKDLMHNSQETVHEKIQGLISSIDNFYILHNYL